MILDATAGVTKSFNIASYALFTMMIAQVCDFELVDYQAHPHIKAPISV